MKNDGGPAFPGKRVESFSHPYGGGTEKQEVLDSGMSLRDYFAAKAINGIISNPNWTVGQRDYQQMADDAFKMADAMLLEREK